VFPFRLLGDNRKRCSIKKNAFCLAGPAKTEEGKARKRGDGQFASRGGGGKSLEPRQTGRGESEGFLREEMRLVKEGRSREELRERGGFSST